MRAYAARHFDRMADTDEDLAMIPLILLHIALAQLGVPDTHGIYSRAHESAQVGQPCMWQYQTNPPNCIWDTIYGERNYSVKPAEHIIEIRTKHEIHAMEVVKPGAGPIPYSKSDYMICPAGFKRYEVGTLWECERVTKTLWIDGQKYGVIKEVEEK